MKFFLLLSLLASSSFAGTVVTMKTSMGSIDIELNDEKAPITVKNFLGYVDSRFYDGTIFHRVINGFMIQGGGFDEKMREKKTQAPIPNESKNGLSNDKGTIAMARTSDPKSATAQFFINVEDNPSLNFGGASSAPDGNGYAVFGKVIKGMDVVNRIKMVKTGNLNGYSDVPMDTVTILSVRKN